jgi:hypothetical protein
VPTPIPPRGAAFARPAADALPSGLETDGRAGDTADGGGAGKGLFAAYPPPGTRTVAAVVGEIVAAKPEVVVAQELAALALLRNKATLPPSILLRADQVIE